MKEYYGHYLGICIDNQDPEYRGRVQIFIPHIMPALYEGWNQEGQDISLECLGDNLPTSLNSNIVEKLKKVLPWAEGALPIVGSSVAGTYNSQSGLFNQGSEADSLVSKYNSINPTTRASFAQELQDPAVQERFYTLMKAEVGGQGADAQLAFTETVFNRALVEKRSVSSIISDQRYYEPYKNGAFQRAANNLTNTDRQNFSGLISKVQNGSNITNGATHNASGSVAANAVSRYDAVPSSLVNIGGETYYSKTFEQKRLSNIFQPGSMTLNDPTMYPDRSSLPPTTGPFGAPEPPVQTSLQPSDQAVIQAQGGGSGSSGSFDQTFKDRVLGSSGRLTRVNAKGKTITLCGVGTRKAVGLALGDSYYSNTGLGEGAYDSVKTNYWTKKGDFKPEPFPSNYRPQQGDVLVHKLNKTGTTAGHAQIYLDNKWHSWKSGDDAVGYINKSGQQTSLFRLTPQGKKKLTDTNIADASLIDKEGDLIASSQPGTDSNGSESDINTNVIKNTTPTQPSPLDTTGMPQGAFVIPAPGALLWVFFREGNPLFPVYFAASYGQKEWQNAYKASSQPHEYGDTHILRPGSAGAIVSRGKVSEQGDTREMRIAHANGAYVGMHAHGTVAYSPNEHMQHTDGDSYWYGAGDEEDFAMGNRNWNTMGNKWEIVGNASQRCIMAQQELLAKVKQINEKMMQGGNNTSAA
jgi:hypothetical protein